MQYVFRASTRMILPLQEVQVRLRLLEPRAPTLQHRQRVVEVYHVLTTMTAWLKSRYA